MTLIREKFHTFDALRFFCFLFVFISHQPYWLFPPYEFLETRGEIAVSFFFTLSGFLITYIILIEKSNFGNFDFKKYMTRRVLRIWPLYYAVLLFALLTPFMLEILGFTESNKGYEPNWLLSAAFLENYMVIWHRESANVSPLPVTWSVCIEEHFYIVWGAIVYFTKVKKLPFWFVGIIATAILSRFIFDHFDRPFRDILTNFDAFIFGAIPAWLYVRYRERVIQKVASVNVVIKIMWILLTIVYCFSALHLDYAGQRLIEPLLTGILFMGILFIMLPAENELKISDQNIFSKLGLYTYGLYLFNVIAVNFAIRVYSKMEFNYGPFITMLLIFSFSLALTVVAAIASYHLFEKRFLKLKPR